MQISSQNLYNIGNNYTVQLNDKEALVYEDDTLRKSEKSEYEKLKSKEAQEKEKEENSPDKLSDDEKRLVYELQARDAEVRAHESAHQSAGAVTGAASFTYQQGPDGKMYAIGGEVSVSMKAGSSPDETIRNAQAVIAAALAPSDPSGQDLAVASSARLMMMKAEQQKAREIQEEMSGHETYKKEANSSQNLDTKNKIDFAA